MRIELGPLHFSSWYKLQRRWEPGSRCKYGEEGKSQEEILLPPVDNVFVFTPFTYYSSV